MSGTVTVEIFKGRSSVDEGGEPDETVEVPADENVVWKDDPWFSSGPLGFRITAEDRPATLYIYTNDSVREPHKADTGEWNGPVERGLEYPDPGEYYPPFGCELWGRVMFSVGDDLRTDGGRLPEFVDEARVMGGLAHCEDCGYSVRFDGEETYREAVDLWFDDQHAGCKL